MFRLFVAITHRFPLFLLFVLAIKLVIALAVPLTIDEAYYYEWGKYLHLHYLDHPPLIGWILWLMLLVDDSVVWLRLPAVLTSIVLTYVWCATLSACFENRREEIRIGMAIFAISPLSLLNVIITTDIPQIFFSGLAGAALVLAFQCNRPLYSFYAGMCMGLALLSKLLIVFFLPAIFLFFLIRRSYWRHAVAFFCTLLPFCGLLLWLNYSGCWSNLMFIFNHSDDSPWYVSVPTYVLTVFYVSFPLGIWILQKASWRLEKDNAPALFLVIGIFPLLAFLFLSFFTGVGLHWIFSFQIMWSALVAVMFTEEILTRTLKCTVLWTGFHVILLLVVIFAPLKMWNDSELIRHPVFDLKTEEVYNQVKLKPGRILFGESYKTGAFFSYFSKELVPNFWSGSHHGRADDVLVDFRMYANKNLSIFDDIKPDLSRYAPFFENVSVREIAVRGTPFWIVEGNNFKFEVYREKVLSNVWKSYYVFPQWLPIGRCVFAERYKFSTLN